MLASVDAAALVTDASVVADATGAGEADVSVPVGADEALAEEAEDRGAGVAT